MNLYYTIPLGMSTIIFKNFSELCYTQENDILYIS